MRVYIVVMELCACLYCCYGAVSVFVLLLWSCVRVCIVVMELCPCLYCCYGAVSVFVFVTFILFYLFNS